MTSTEKLFLIGLGILYFLTRPKKIKEIDIPFGPPAPSPTCERSKPTDWRIENVKLGIEWIGHLIEKYKDDLDGNIIASIISVESKFDPNAIGKDNEYGLMQIKLATARDMGFSGNSSLLFDPEINIKYGTKYLKYQLKRYSNIGYAIAAYNAGSAMFNEVGNFINQDYFCRVWNLYKEI